MCAVLLVWYSWIRLLNLVLLLKSPIRCAVLNFNWTFILIYIKLICLIKRFISLFYSNCHMITLGRARHFKVVVWLSKCHSFRLRWQGFCLLCDLFWRVEIITFAWCYFWMSKLIYFLGWRFYHFDFRESINWTFGSSNEWFFLEFVCFNPQQIHIDKVFMLQNLFNWQLEVLLFHHKINLLAINNLPCLICIFMTVAFVSFIWVNFLVSWKSIV